MSEHVTEYLPEAALGVLETSLQERVAVHVASCAVCAAWLAELRTVCTPAVSEPKPIPTSVMIGVLKPAPRAGPVRVTPFQDRRQGGLAAFCGRFSQFFMLERALSLRLLEKIERGDAWLPGPADGIEVFPVRTPIEGALTLVVRAKPGAVFPRHAHTGDEWTLLMQGGLESDGLAYWRGDRLVKRTGSTHEPVALQGPDCICAVRLHGELELL